MAHLTNLPNQATSQDRLRVLAADTSSMNTQLLVEALSRDAQFQMIEAPPTEATILALVKSEKPHIALIGAKIGDSNESAFNLVRSICAKAPSSRVVVILDSSDRAAVVEAFRAGARGVFCRTEPFRLLAKCIACVHSGQVWASSSELHFLLEALAQPTFANFRDKDSSPLSAREIDVVRCVAEGLTNRQIAQRLKLTEHTVKNYLFRIFDKLELSSRVEVVLYALGNSVPRNSPPSDNRRHSQPIAVTHRSNESRSIESRSGESRSGESKPATQRPSAIPVPIRKTAT